ncbi:MAG: type II secretion system protein GspM [Shimia sp.]
MSVLASLNPRERLLVFAVLPVALLVALYQFAWLPLADLRAEHSARIADYRTVTVAAATMDSAPVVQAAPADPRPLATRITATAQAAGLPLRRLEPEGPRIRVLVEDAPFADLIAWIAEMETGAGLRLVSLEVDRRAAPGTVSARLILEDAP